MLQIQIENLKNITELKIELPLTPGLYAVTGINGIGKSTLFTALSRLVYRKALINYFRYDGDHTTKIIYEYNSLKNTWVRSPFWQRENNQTQEIFFDGFYEGSLIYGNRFADAHTSKLHSLFKIKDIDLCEANDFVKENLGEILKGDKKFYSGLKRIKEKHIAKELNFSGIPYVLAINGKKIYQPRMSSGEYLLIGLLHYLLEKINYAERRRNPSINLVLLDEIELALHPSAQERLAVFLDKISQEYNFCIYFSTHSIQIINKISPHNIFHLDQGVNGRIEVINPCYAAYATRCMYMPDGVDFIFLVEDDLARHMVEKAIREKKLNISRLIKVVPAGGWENTLRLQSEITSSVLTGANCKVVSILDGDVQSECNKKYGPKTKYGKLEKRFLPIQSLEKYLLEKLIKNPSFDFCKSLGDNFYKVRPLKDILMEYENKIERGDLKKDNNGKRLLESLINAAEDTWDTKEIFERDLCYFIADYESGTSLQDAIVTLCS